MAILALACTVVVITTLSMSAISTNGAVQGDFSNENHTQYSRSIGGLNWTIMWFIGGGTYFLISRSLGGYSSFSSPLSFTAHIVIDMRYVFCRTWIWRSGGNCVQSGQRRGSGDEHGRVRRSTGRASRRKTQWPNGFLSSDSWNFFKIIIFYNALHLFLILEPWSADDWCHQWRSDLRNTGVDFAAGHHRRWNGMGSEGNLFCFLPSNRFFFLLSSDKLRLKIFFLFWLLDPVSSAGSHYRVLCELFRGLLYSSIGHEACSRHRRLFLLHVFGQFLSGLPWRRVIHDNVWTLFPRVHGHHGRSQYLWRPQGIDLCIPFPKLITFNRFFF